MPTWRHCVPQTACQHRLEMSNHVGNKVTVCLSVRLDILSVALPRIQVLQYVMPCQCLSDDWHFEGTMFLQTPRTSCPMTLSPMSLFVHKQDCCVPKYRVFHEQCDPSLHQQQQCLFCVHCYAFAIDNNLFHFPTPCLLLPLSIRHVMLLIWLGTWPCRSQNIVICVWHSASKCL